MSGRPPILYPLFAGVESLVGVGKRTAGLLEQIGITRPRDLIFTLPQSGMERRPVETILGLEPPVMVMVEVTVGRHTPAKRRGGPYVILAEDAKTAFHVVHFRGKADWLQKQFPPGERRVVAGKLELRNGVGQIAHPEVFTLDEAADLPPFEPIYPLTTGLVQSTMRKAVSGALTRVDDLPEWIAPEHLAREAWPAWADAVRTAHAPQAVSDLAAEAPARQRLAYDEIFAHQMTLALVRADQRARKGRVTQGTGRLQNKVLDNLPFAPTSAQRRAVAEITADMAAPIRMLRLLQGDVGSGKTLVALLALLAAVEAGGQGVLMAPTEILARQHMESLVPLADVAGVTLTLLTGRDKGRSRAAKLADLAEGRTGILVGTHAVFQKDVIFADLRLAIVDEQHRFGVAQRLELGAKGQAADMLVMTATPIPRSLTLAQYGHMELSVLDEKPPGRTPVKTALVSTARMAEVVAHLRDAVAEGRQAYWVCPLVEENEDLPMTAAEERFKLLRAELGEGRVGLVHGQMPPADKDAAMARFVAGETAVLVATTVIEVGVNVPNASIMVIEQAERFGLSQLHQLRGRVGRGAAASNCLLLYQAPLGETARRRLTMMRETEDGFRIAEEDLALRGAGDVIGMAQSGLPRFQIADLERQTGLMVTAQRDARALLTLDPDLATARGEATRTLLYLMEQDRAIRLISGG